MKKKKTWSTMNLDELQRATADLDRELVLDAFGDPPPKAKARLARARAKRGRPKIGRGAQIVSVSIERSLLERADAVARRLGLTRARLIARGLAAVLAVEGEDEPSRPSPPR